MSYNNRYDRVDDHNSYKSNIDANSRLQDSFDDWRGGFLRVETRTAAEILAEKGKSFVASQRANNVSSGSTVDYAIRTATNEPTIVNFNMNVGGRVRIDFYEDSTVSNGTNVINENLNRSTDANTSSDVEVLAGVTVDTQGDRIAVGGAGGTATNAGQNAVPATVVGSPWILAPDTTYLYRVQNVSGSQIDINPTLGYTTRSFE